GIRDFHVTGVQTCALPILRRYNANRDLTPADREAIVTLVRELGHDPDNIAKTFAITCDSTGVRLHLTEHLRDESGMWYMDVAADQIASRPHVHDIDPSQLPEAIRPPA